jgi:hypothetical protein
MAETYLVGLSQNGQLGQFRKSHGTLQPIMVVATLFDYVHLLQSRQKNVSSNIIFPSRATRLGFNLDKTQ